MGDDPIRYNDPDGDIFGLDNLVGAAIGAVFEYGSQVVENKIQGKSWGESFTHVDGGKIAGAAVVGFVTDGVANLAGKALRRVGTEVVANLAPTVSKLAESNIVKQGPELVEKTAGAIAKKTGGRLGNTATRKQIAEIATKLEERGYTITGGGGKADLVEEYLKPLGGGRKGFVLRHNCYSPRLWDFAYKYG